MPDPDDLAGATRMRQLRRQGGLICFGLNGNPSAAWGQSSAARNVAQVVENGLLNRGEPVQQAIPALSAIRQSDLIA